MHGQVLVLLQKSRLSWMSLREIMFSIGCKCLGIYEHEVLPFQAFPCLNELESEASSCLLIMYNLLFSQNYIMFSSFLFSPSRLFCICKEFLDCKDGYGCRLRRSWWSTILYVTYGWNFYFIFYLSHWLCLQLLFSCL